MIIFHDSLKGFYHEVYEGSLKIIFWMLFFVFFVTFVVFFNC